MTPTSRRFQKLLPSPVLSRGRPSNPNGACQNLCGDCARGKSKHNGVKRTYGFMAFTRNKKVAITKYLDENVLRCYSIPDQERAYPTVMGSSDTPPI